LPASRRASGSCPPPRPDISVTRELAPALSPEDVALLARLAPATPTAYHRLNPLTKAVAAIVVSIAVLVAGGYVVPLLLFAAVVASAATARALGRAVRLALVASLPVLFSVVLVSMLTRAGDTVLLHLGPFDVTAEGVDFAARITLRLAVLTMAVVVFGLTTEPRELVADLERRGVSPRVTFAAATAVEAIPAMLERASTVTAAQRSRGLDTEGSVGARLRGITALAGPVLLSSIAEVEERSLALEARAFDRPGRRVPLWAPADSSAQRLARWALVGGPVVLVALRAGPLGWLP
jgi:energy-coupling factor transport system permease protein